MEATQTPIKEAIDFINTGRLRRILKERFPGQEIGNVELPSGLSTEEALRYILDQRTVYSGRTGSTVQDTSARSAQNNTIEKDNKDPGISEIETKILRRYKTMGYAVPIIYSINGAKITMEKISGKTLRTHIIDSFISTSIAYAKYREETITRDGHAHNVMNIEEYELPTLKRLETLFDRALSMSINMDLDLSDILDMKDKAYLQQRKTSSLANQFSKTDQEIEENKDAYRILQSLDISDENFVSTFKPFQERLNEIKSRYNQWIISPSTQNIKVVNNSDQSELWVLDGNHAESAPIQTSLFYLLDAYLPIKHVNGIDDYVQAIDPKTGEKQLTDMLTSPLTETTKIGWAKKAFDLLNANDPMKYQNDFKSFLMGYVVNRVPLSIRQIRYALDEADSASDPYSYYDAVMEAFHFRNILNTSLQVLDNPKSGITTITDIRTDIGRRVDDYMKLRLSESKYDLAVDCLKLLSLEN